MADATHRILFVPGLGPDDLSGLTPPSRSAALIVSPPWRPESLEARVLEPLGELPDSIEVARVPRDSIAEALRDRIAALPTDAVLWVVGGPLALRCERRIDAPDGARPAGSLAYLAAEPTPVERDRLLRMPGIERVLAGDSIRTLGLAGPLVVAELGTSFEDGPRCFGHPDGAIGSLLVYGEIDGPDWPASVHDTRIAPTLARLAGREDTGFEDRPL